MPVEARASLDGWEMALADVLDRREPVITPHFQPLVDLERGVVAGYEMLARFDHPIGGSPVDWFDAAGKLGRAHELDLRILAIARRALGLLPTNTFLSVNVTGAGAGTQLIVDAIRNGPRLEPMVIEITEQTDGEDPERLELAAGVMRERGAMLAIDDAGAGYASLQRILSVRPQFIKLDRSLITQIHNDEAKAAATEMMGALANRIDAWVVAEGVERLGELERLMQMRVPLAQGYLFGKPAPQFDQVDARWAARAREFAGERAGSLITLLERVQPAMAAAGEEEVGWRFDDDPALEYLPVIDADGKSAGVIDRRAYESGSVEPEAAMRVSPTTSPAEVLRRAMTRPRDSRLTPVICCDEFGRYLGKIRVERLVEAVAD